MSTTHNPGNTGNATQVRKAGAFDMRNFIAGLIGFYGVVLLICGIFGSSDAQSTKSDGLNINLWAGLGMIVAALGFVLWARLRPVVITVPPDNDAN